MATRTTLEGMFDKQYEAKALPKNEEEYIAMLVEGSKYRPEDIVAVGLATIEVNTRHIHIDQLALTKRGKEEHKNSKYSAHYKALIAQSEEFSDLNIKKKPTKSDRDIYYSIRIHYHDTQFFDLGGETGNKGEKRILALNMAEVYG